MSSSSMRACSPRCTPAASSARSTRSIPASSSTRRSTPSTTRCSGIAETKRVDGESGKLMTVPINPYIPLLYYRTDLYQQKGLKVPETWDELLTNAKALNAPPRMYGIVQRGARGAFDVTYDLLPYLWSHGGGHLQGPEGRRFHRHDQQPQDARGPADLPPPRQGSRPSADRRTDPDRRDPGDGDGQGRRTSSRCSRRARSTIPTSPPWSARSASRRRRMRRDSKPRRRSATGSAASRATFPTTASAPRSPSWPGSRRGMRRSPMPRQARPRCGATCWNPISRRSPSSAG